MSANNRRDRVARNGNPAIRAECKNNPRFRQLLAMATANGLPETLQVAYLDAYWGCTDLQIGIATRMISGYSWEDYLTELNGDLADEYIDNNPRAALLRGGTAQCRQRIERMCARAGWEIIDTGDCINVVDANGEPVTISTPYNRQNKDTALRATLEQIEILI